MTNVYDQLLKRLEESEVLGLGICGEAALAIRKLTRDIDKLQERHKNSRADRLAAAYQWLRGQVLQLRGIISDLQMYYDSELDLDDIRNNLNERLNTIEKSIDPDPIGKSIIEEINRLSYVENELRDLYARTAQVGGLQADALLSLGISVEHCRIEGQHEPIYMMDGVAGHIHHDSAIAVKFKTKNQLGAEYFIDLMDKMMKKSR